MKKTQTFQGDPQIVAASHQVSADLSGEAAILNLKSGKYFGLNAVGARVWELIQQPRRVSEMRAAILEEYDVPEGEWERDLEALLQQLLEKELIEIL